jgi:adenylate kinase
MLTMRASSTPSLSSPGADQAGIPVVLEQPRPTTVQEIAAHVDDAGVRVTERFVAVVGPPAVGKSTVTGALADRLGARVFRLRDFAHKFRSRPAADQRLFNTCDSLGWLPEETVFLLLQAALLHGQFPARGLVALENFPGSLTQFLLLTAIADQLRAPLTLIELTAADTVVAARARARRVCPTCEPDPRGDPHRPSLRTTRDPDRCDSCGGGLLPRRGDEPQRFAARLARFRRRIPAIRRAATALHISYDAVDSTSDPDTCLQGVTAALAATEPSAHSFASLHMHP